jgi:hypothetical protein
MCFRGLLPRTGYPLMLHNPLMLHLRLPKVPNSIELKWVKWLGLQVLDDKQDSSLSIVPNY